MKTPCPECGQGAPVFVVCRNCSFLTVECDERGELFMDPKNLDKGLAENCPNCGTQAEDFELASSTEIIAGGFTKEDYE